MGLYQGFGGESNVQNRDLSNILNFKYVVGVFLVIFRKRCLLGRNRSDEHRILDIYPAGYIITGRFKYI